MGVHSVHWGTSYFLAYSCELFVVEGLNVRGNKSVSVNLSSAILGFLLSLTSKLVF